MLGRAGLAGAPAGVAGEMSCGEEHGAGDRRAAKARLSRESHWALRLFVRGTARVGACRSPFGATRRSEPGFGTPNREVGGGECQKESAVAGREQCFQNFKQREYSGLGQELLPCRQKLPSSIFGTAETVERQLPLRLCDGHLLVWLIQGSCFSRHDDGQCDPRLPAALMQHGSR